MFCSSARMASLVWSPSLKWLELFRRSMILSAPLKSSSNTLTKAAVSTTFRSSSFLSSLHPKAGFPGCAAGRSNLQAEMVPLEVNDMAKLSLMFEEKMVKEVPVGSRPVRIGRSPDNDLDVDNLPVSNDHARVYFDSGRLLVDDRGSLNGTFLNDLRLHPPTLPHHLPIRIPHH